MILFINGPDTFRSRQYLKEQVERFKKLRDPLGYNVIFLDGKKEEIGKVLSELAAAPFLAEKRMVVIENLLSNNNKELLAEIKNRIKNKTIPVSTVTLIWQGEPLSKIKEAKELETLLKKEKYAQEFVILSGPQLLTWAKDEIAKRGNTIAGDALTQLCQNADEDLWLLNSLIDELIAYAAGRKITTEDVQLFTEEKVDDNAFNMVDAIVGGNQKLAYKLLFAQRRLGEDDIKIFGLLVWQFRILLSMADLMERSLGAPLRSDELAKQLGIHPFVAKKNMAAARRTPLSKLQVIYQELLNIDIKTKTGLAPADVLVDLFVSKM